jgi:hypothetical protein
MERAIVNSIESYAPDEDIEVCECVKQLEACKEELEPVKVEEMIGEESTGVPTLSGEGEKKSRIERTSFSLEVCFS